MLDVPDVVREKALAVGAGAWIEKLPSLVRSVEADWGITVGRPYRDSTEAFVAEATCDDGMPAVLKLIVPRDGDAAAHEVTVLRLAAGEGCPRLLRDDVGRGALLLERLGRSLFELGLPTRGRHEILVAAAARIWRPAPDSGLPTGAAKARWLAEFITAMWEELDRPCTERAVEHALECAARRGDAHRDETAVLVHGDVHQWNALEAGDGLQARRSRRPPRRARVRPRHRHARGPDSKEIRANGPDGWRTRRASTSSAIWEWGVVERVSTGLLGTRVNLQPIARQMLAAADDLAD